MTNRDAHSAGLADRRAPRNALQKLRFRRRPGPLLLMAEGTGDRPARDSHPRLQ